MNLLDFTISNTSEYIKKMPKDLRKKYGQFFTSKETAIFMSELFDRPLNTQSLEILDAGAGSGILSMALLNRLQTFSGIQEVKLTCYENDPNIVSLLKENLTWAQNNIRRIQFSFIIREENYILSQISNYNGLNTTNEKYDLIIGNPPYLKISKDAPEAKAMSDVCYGAPNLYFLFISMGAFNLRNNSEMVYIIPRSWTSGAYFKQFRQKFLRECALKHIHLFVSRDKVFQNENVLQETMIIKAIKSQQKPENITITTSQSSSDFSNKTNFIAPYNSVVSGEDLYVFLTTCQKDVETLNILNRWTDNLLNIGLKMKTGLTVDFRNKQILCDKFEPSSVPLFHPQHIQNGKIFFPANREQEYILTDKKGLLQPNTNYLFVKRFTTKEEHRRLQCGIYIASEYPHFTQISTQNKINFITGTTSLSKSIVYGLYVLFNSTIYDSYYRILNGSTQVNSTEINSMPVPPINIIESMGYDLIQADDYSEISCDKILRSYL